MGGIQTSECPEQKFYKLWLIDDFLWRFFSFLVPYGAPRSFRPIAPNLKFSVCPSSYYFHGTLTFECFKLSTQILCAVPFLHVLYSKLFGPHFPSSFLESLCFLFPLSPVYLNPVANRASSIFLSGCIGGLLLVAS